MMVFILPNFSGGGAERVSINIINRLYLKGYDVELIVFNSNGNLKSLLQKDISLHNLNSNSLRTASFKLVQLLNILKPNIIFSTFGYVNLFLIILKPFFFNKSLIWAREANLPSISLPNNKYPFLMRIGYFLLYRFANRVFCTSNLMKREFQNNYHVSTNLITILPNPVDETYIRNMCKISNKLRSKEVLFVAAGRLVHQKGFDSLLFWFSRLNNQSAELCILGDGPLKSDLEQLARNLKIHKRVLFLGYSENPWTWLASADAFLLPSRWEGMSNVALESLCCGTPVIATKESGGISELSKDSLLGAVIVANSEEDFITAMNLIKKNTETKFPRKSLLPDAYRINNVVNSVEKWLHY
jgi:glycosyltransferase involved in cell wall biosynthesis